MQGANRSPFAKHFEEPPANKKDFSMIAVAMISMLLIIGALTCIIWMQAKEIEKPPVVYHTTEVLKPQHLYPRIPQKFTIGTYRIRCRWSVTTMGVVQGTREGCGSGWGINLSEYGMPEHRYLITAAHVVLQDITGAKPPVQQLVDYLDVQIRTDKVKKWVKCKVLVADPDADTAVLEAEEELPYVFPLADDCDVGTPVVIAGCPVGTTPSAQIGWLASKDPEFNMTKIHCPVWQTFAEFYKGNSGGPIFDPERDKVIAMLVAGILPDKDNENQMVPGVAICIPCYVIRAVLDKTFHLADEPVPNDERLMGPKPVVPDPPKAEVVPLSPKL